MFKFKHEIELVTKEKVWLFGEDYYNDKRVFWLAHQSELEKLRIKIDETGFPVTVRDLQNKSIVLVSSEFEFNNWLSNNQP